MDGIGPLDSSMRAIVFDKDGVLADSESINLRSAFEIFSAHGYELGPEEEPWIVGRHPLDYVPVFGERFDISAEKQQRMIEEQDVIYSRIWRDHGRLLDGAREALSAAQASPLAVGLATSSTRSEVEEFLDRFELRPFFEITVSLDDVVNAKPAPEIYLSAARQLGVEPASMVIVEDSEPGVQAAKASGARCVAVRTPQVPAERVSRADAFVDSVAEVGDWLRRARQAAEKP